MKAFFQKFFSLFLAFFFFLSGLLQGGGSGNSQQPTPVPDTPSDGMQTLVYGADATRQSLNLALPAQKGETGLVLFIHGGAWIFGDKAIYNDVAAQWASAGYVAATMSYRYISDTVHMNDLLDDIGAALAKIKETAAAAGYTVNKAILAGMSAGAHLSMLYAYARKSSAPITPAAVVSFCGPSDLTRADFLENNALGSLNDMLDLMAKAGGVRISAEEYTNKSGNYEAFMSALRAVSPITYAADAVPTVFAQGEKDNIVPFAGVKALSEALTAAGITNDFVSYPNSGHDLANDPDSAEQVYNLSVQYAQTYLK